MHGNLCGDTSGTENTNFAPPSGNTQQSNTALISLHHRTPVSGVDGTLDDPSESDLLEFPTSHELRAEDDESDEVESESNDKEDDGDVPLTQPLENLPPEVFRASRPRPLSDVDAAIRRVYGDVIRQRIELTLMGASGMMQYGKLTGEKL